MANLEPNFKTNNKIVWVLQARIHRYMKGTFDFLVIGHGGTYVTQFEFKKNISDIYNKKKSKDFAVILHW